MAVRQVTINECECDECTHLWHSVIMPEKCPRCRSRKWNASGKTPAAPARATGLRLGAAKTARMAGKLDVVSAIQSGKAGTGKASTLTYEPVD